MPHRWKFIAGAGASVTIIALACGAALGLAGQPDKNSEPAEPRIVTPGAAPCMFAPPSDAIILFDGTNLDEWTVAPDKDPSRGPAKWKPEGKRGGAMTIEPHSGSIVTKRTFGDAQIHVEFATPEKVEGDGQERGNSGVYLQGRYEVQVLDSFNNKTYFDGQCGAVYKQHAPLVNASRAPGQWQTYDIIFHAARFDPKGQKVSPARVTVLHNGVLIQDEATITGTTGGSLSPEGPGEGPLYLQDHGNPGRYRNIWMRPL